MAAKLFVVRQDFASAIAAVENGIAAQSRQVRHDGSMPATSGLHWLRGLLLLRDGRITQSILSFAREIDELADNDVEAAEIRVSAQVGAGFAHLTAGDPAGAIDVFRLALETRPHAGRALIGLQYAFRRTFLAEEAEQLTAQIDRAIALAAEEQSGEAALLTAAAKLIRGDTVAAYVTLERFLEETSVRHAGWLIPIDPALAGLRPNPKYPELMALLART